MNDDFGQQLATIGFALAQTDYRGIPQYARKPNRFLTEWIHDLGHGEVLFTWEFELGEYCEEVGWQIGSNETSFHILFPKADLRLARDLEAVTIEVERLEVQLNGLDLADPAL